MMRRTGWARLGAGVVVGVVLSGLSVASEPLAPDAASPERASSATATPDPTLAEHERALQACRAKLPDFLRGRLDAQEQAWRRDLEIECADSDTACRAAASRQRDAAMRAAFPQCGPSGEAALTPPVAGRGKTGMLPARWTPRQGASQEVPFSFTAESADTGSMSTTLGKGGEQFHGSYARIRRSTKGELVTAIYDGWSSPEWETWTHDSEGHWTPTGVSFGEFARFYTGKVVATLRSREGSSMRCQLTLREPASGLLGGGSGACQISDGGRLSLEF